MRNKTVRELAARNAVHEKMLEQLARAHHDLVMGRCLSVEARRDRTRELRGRK